MPPAWRSIKGHAVHFQPPRRHRLSGHARRQHVGVRGRHGRRHRNRVSIRTKICTWAIAAARCSRSAAARQIYVFATLEPSIAAYHLAFGPDGYLYVTGPTTSSFDSVHRISPTGDVEMFYRGLGRPQGMAFDANGNLYVAASLGGRRGVVRFDHDRNPELFLSGPAIVGLAFTPSRAWRCAPTTHSRGLSRETRSSRSTSAS